MLRKTMVLAVLMVLVSSGFAAAQLLDDLQVQQRTPPFLRAGSQAEIKVDLELQGTTSYDGVVFEVQSGANDGLVYVPGTARTSAGMISEEPTTGSLLFQLGPMNPGDVVQLTYDLRAMNAWPAGPGPHTGSWVLVWYAEPVAVRVPAITEIDILAAPELTLTKDDRGEVLGIGSNVTYTVAARNEGTQNATGVVLEDQLPPGLVVDSTRSDPRWTCAAPDAQGTLCRIDDPGLDVGELLAAQLVVRWSGGPVPAGLESVVNRATVRDDGNNTLGESVTAEASETTPLVASPDLSLVKRATVPSVRPGEQLAFDLEIRNGGSQVANDVVVLDDVPPRSRFVAQGSTLGWSCGTEGTCALAVGSVGVGETLTATMVVEVDPSVPAGVEEIVNVARVTDDGVGGPDPTPDDNFAEARVPVLAAPDLRVDKASSAPSARPGDEVEFVIQVANVGDQDATGVELVDLIPDSAGVRSASGWSCAGSECRVDLASLPAGDSVTRTLTLELAPSVPAGFEELVNQATASDDGANGPDPTPENNQDEASVTVVAGPDLWVTKTAEVSEAGAGETVVFRIQVGNRGTQGADGVVLTDRLPPLVGLGTASDWSCANRVCEISIGDLPVGQTVEHTIALKVPATVPADLEAVDNFVDVTDSGANGPDLDPSDNIAVASVRVVATAELGVRKTARSESVTPGDVLVYDLTVSNTGHRTASGVEIEESVPQYTSSDPESSSPGWDCVAETCRRSLGEVDPGGTRAVTFAVRVDETGIPAGVVAIVNRVRVEDSDGGTEDEDTTTVVLDAAPDLTVTKDDGVEEVAEGSQVRYAITVSNVGSQDAVGVVLTEVVPAGSDAAGSETLGWSCPEGTDAGAACSMALDGPLAVGEVVPVEFTVTALPGHPELTQLINTVTVADDGSQGQDLDPSSNRATETTPVVRAEGPDPGPDPVLQAWKRDALVLDQDDDGRADMGDIVSYQVDLVAQADGGAAEAVEVLLAPPPGTRMLPGTVLAPTGRVLSETAQGAVVRVDRIEAGESAGVSFDVEVLELAGGVTELVCQGEVVAGNHPRLVTDDPDTPEALDPTRTPADSTSDDGEPPSIHDIPTLGEWMLIAFAVLLLGAGAWTLERCRRRDVLVGLVVLAVVVAACWIAPQPAQAQWAVFDIANLVEQVRQFIQMLQDYLLKYEDYLIQIQQYQQMYAQLRALETNLEDFENLASRELASALWNVQDRSSQYDGIIYTRPDLHQQYQEWFDPRASDDLLQIEGERNQRVLDSLQAMVGTMRDLGRQTVKSQQDLGGAKAQLDGAAGALQVSQAQGIISAHTAEEVSRAVEALVAVGNAQVVGQAHEIAERASAAETAREWFRRGRSPAPWYRGERAFSPVPTSFTDGGRP